MGTVLRPELSEKNKYYISKQRYYELKHFCMQYHEWKEAIKVIDLYPRIENGEYIVIADVARPVEKCMELREGYLYKVKLIEDVCKAADPDICQYLLIGITEGVSYEFLYSRLDIPCSKDYYYDRYRRFFWLLDRARN